MGDIWTTSDLHLFHNREFLYEPRGFSCVTDMNEAIVENWNKLIAWNDDVYVLGDLMLNDNENGIKYLKALKGNLHICVGNHDTDDRIKLYGDCYNVVEIEYGYRLKIGKWRFYMSHFPTLVGNYDDEKAPTRQLYNLCGHTHTPNVWTDWDKGRIFHVEMDTNECKPWNMEDIVELIRGRI